MSRYLTVKQLRNFIKDLPDNFEVVIEAPEMRNLMSTRSVRVGCAYPDDSGFVTEEQRIASIGSEEGEYQNFKLNAICIDADY